MADTESDVPVTVAGKQAELEAGGAAEEAGADAPGPSAEELRIEELEEKLKHTLADFQNLQRKTRSDIENGVNAKIDGFMVDFLQIYDDFVRARDAASGNDTVTEGFDSILKNMDALLLRYGVRPIDALGEIFDPNFHEAISITEDDALDENTITREIRKGYISHNRVIRPVLVEISKRAAEIK